MKKELLFLFICVISLQCHVSSYRNRRFIGGKNAKSAQFPYIVSLQKYIPFYQQNKHYCAGSIINKNLILTAAHCVHDIPLRNISIVPGTHILNKKTYRYQVSKIIFHKNFHANLLKYDIAIIKLEKNIKLSKYVQKISLETKEIPENATLTVSGWGFLKYTPNSTLSNILQYSNVKPISLKRCRRQQWALILFGIVTIDQINKKMICTMNKNRGFCNGDSGGPLVYDSKQVGIVSWTFGCARYPDVYTKVSAYNFWINKTIKLLK